jgi:hypothetical protein
MIRSLDLLSGGRTLAEFPGAIELLSGLRSTLGVLLEEIPYAVRNALLYFFLLFVWRVLLRNQWAAALAFALMFTLLNALGNEDKPWLGAAMGFLYFGSGAVVVLRWGLLSFAVAHFVSSTLMSLPTTFDLSAWYFGNMVLLLALVIALAAWGFYTSLGGRVWNDSLIEQSAR